MHVGDISGFIAQKFKGKLTKNILFNRERGEK